MHITFHTLLAQHHLHMRDRFYIVLAHLEAGHHFGQAVAAALLGPALGRAAQAHLLQPLQAVSQLAGWHWGHQLGRRPAPAPLLLFQGSPYGGQDVKGGFGVNGKSLSLKVASTQP